MIDPDHPTIAVSRQCRLLGLARINLGRAKSKEWDTCAPHLVLSEAGGVLTDLEGRPIHYNRADVYHNHGLAGSNGPLHQTLLERIHKFLEDNPQSSSST